MRTEEETYVVECVFVVIVVVVKAIIVVVTDDLVLESLASEKIDCFGNDL